MASHDLPVRPIDRWAVVIGVSMALVFVLGIAIDCWWLRLLSKPWPVVLMILALGRRELADVPYRWRIRAGLMASLVGDMLLAWSEATFLPGVGAFLLAHLFYTAAFVAEERRWRPLLALPFAAWGVAVVSALRPGLEAADMKLPIIVYSTAICTMLWRAFARLDLRPPDPSWQGPRIEPDLLLAALGALLFALSDTLIAVDRFGPSFETAPYLIITLYWLGQWAITQSVLRRDPLPRVPTAPRRES